MIYTKIETEHGPLYQETSEDGQVSDGAVVIDRQEWEEACQAAETRARGAARKRSK